VNCFEYLSVVFFFAVGRRLRQPLNEYHGGGNMCSESKKKCIYAVSKQLGIDVDWKGLVELSEQQASERIDRLKAELDKTETVTGDGSNIKTEQFNQWRFGMVVKIVFDKFPYGYLTENPNIFTKQVRKIYEIVATAEASLKARIKGPSVTTEDAQEGD